MPLKIGSLVENRYRVTARIGHGGMAEVYEGNDIIGKKTVAIKLIRKDVMANPVNLIRFTNEATIAASLNHPNIVKVYNHGTVDGVPYIANEFIKGQNLKQVLDFRSSVPIEEAVDYMIQLASALDYAHSHGIVHRDVKPDNLYVMGDGTIKLGDFGIAQTDATSELTNKNSEIVGSVHYLAPEITSGKPATGQSDIYSAGVTFFELITGHVPYIKNSAIDIAVAHVKEKFPSPKKYLPNCPKEIERIIFKCVKKNPKERYATAKELHDDLVALKGEKGLKEKKGFFRRLFGFK
ncbi:MAG: serine/threonine protein kinase [Bacilli bacterium]|nr:serine/threonine protein kinase [Bacilli bacterium]